MIQIRNAVSFINCGLSMLDKYIIGKFTRQGENNESTQKNM